MNSALTIASQFIRLARVRGVPMDHMKLQKLVYLAHGYWLAKTDKPLFGDPIEAWQYGPVIPAVYRQFRHYGRRLIEHEAATGEPVSETVASHLQEIFDVYGGMSGLRLSALAHQNDTPWSEVNRQFSGSIPTGKDIPDDLMKNYFKRFVTND